MQVMQVNEKQIKSSRSTVASGIVPTNVASMLIQKSVVPDYLREQILIPKVSIVQALLFSDGF